MLSPLLLWGQESINKRQSSKSKSAVFDLSRSLEQDLPTDSIAADYEKVAREFMVKGEFAKAEDYLDRARKLYVQRNNKEKMAYIEREIAKVQELQNKYLLAINTYRLAALMSLTEEQKELNENDALRLENRQSPQEQSNYLQRNINILNTTSGVKKEEIAQTYEQLAEVSLEMNDKEATFSNLQSALQVAEKPSQSIQLKRKMADIYVTDNQIDKAIDINKEILEEAEVKKDTKVQIEQLQTLSTAYVTTQDVNKGITSLQQAYELALQEGHTLDAKKSLEMLVEQYQKQNNNRKALEAYADFIGKLEPLIKADSSLVDEQIFQVHEERISRLESERALQYQLIHQKDVNNNLLTFGFFIMFLAFTVVSFLVLSMNKKNKKIKLQSLRREMNPHFIFNSLNSVNQFIAQNNELEANKYLTSYSRLMRNMMENSNKDFTPLSTELDQLKEYLDLEQMRFHDKVTYTISVAESVDMDAILIPNMLIQPQLENAIWHGLRYKDKGGELYLSVKQEHNAILVKIEDNGIGRIKSQELKTRHQKEHKSRGLTNTAERINLLNSLYNCNIKMDIIDKKGEETGVIIIFNFGKNHDANNKKRNS